MGRFFLDLEFTNGNYYLAEIIEMALVSEISGFAFHTHVKIDNLLTPFVKKLTGKLNNMMKKSVKSLDEQYLQLIVP